MINNNSDKTMEFAKNTITVLTQNLKQEKALNSELIKRVKELEEMLNDIKKNTNSNIVSLKATSKEKQIVELYARGVPVGFIKKVFDEQLYIDVSIEEIETLIMSLTGNRCSVELMEYYNEMKEIFVKRNTIEKGFFASSLHQKFKMLEDEYSISLMKAKEEMDEVRKTKILELMTKLYQAEAQAFSKNTLAVFGKQNVEKTTEDYDKDVENIFGSEKIVSFKKVVSK